MNHTSKRFALSIAALVLFVGSTARADAIRPWSGASASAVALDQAGAASIQTGATASASSRNSVPVTYDGSYYNHGWQQFTVTVQGAADASATGQADHLLSVGASYFAPSPGTLPAQTLAVQTVQATAAWNNDHLTIQGSSIPNVVRLNFSVGLDGNGMYGSTFGGINVEANGRVMTLAMNNFDGGQLHQQGFDSLTSTDRWPYTTTVHYQATFHLDLPVTSSGVSDPFRLSLQATPDTGLSSNFPYSSGPIGDAILSLKSITTTDGRLLSDLGDSVTFASGMLGPGVQPSPIPEPSSIVVIGGLGVAIGLGRRFRRGS